MNLREVDEFFAGVRGRACWSVIGGAGTGSAIQLQFGEKLPARRQVHNPALSQDENLFEGERSLLVLCAWRLEANGRILGTSQSVTEDGSLDVGVLDRIRNETVKELGFSSEVHDLRIEFANGATLAVFCDLPIGEDANYIMFNPATTIGVTGLGFVMVEPR